MDDMQNMQMFEECLVVSVPDTLEETVVYDLRDRALQCVKERAVRKVVIDISSRQILDRFGFNFLLQSGKILSLLGAKVMYAGFQPGVVSALINLNVDFGEIECSATVQDALDHFKKMEKETVLELDEENNDLSHEAESADGEESVNGESRENALSYEEPVL